jgi:hypothetical protein
VRIHTVQRLINDRESLSGTCDNYHIDTDVMKTHMVVNYNALKRSTDLSFLRNIFRRFLLFALGARAASCKFLQHIPKKRFHCSFISLLHSATGSHCMHLPRILPWVIKNSTRAGHTRSIMQLANSL